MTASDLSNSSITLSVIVTPLELLPASSQASFPKKAESLDSNAPTSSKVFEVEIKEIISLPIFPAAPITVVFILFIIF